MLGDFFYKDFLQGLQGQFLICYNFVTIYAERAKGLDKFCGGVNWK